ncbi:MAG: radical SAM protein [Thermoprotei archaeon]|nr:MAG: radical SAM protein [Thermoprotei archaeon]
MVKHVMSWSREILKLPFGTLYIGSLPLGCSLCHKGQKLVLFITGLCNRRCWYCPISDERRGKDIMFANEVQVRDLDEIIKQAMLMDARGTGITGGEPLLVFSILIKIIKLLKSKLGSEHHIHLYTNGELLSRNHAILLKECGLDELRIHITSERSWKGVEIAINAGLLVGIEIPVIPNQLDYYKRLILRAESLGVKFINLNELEVSESNYMAMKLRGYDVKDDVPYAVKGSERTAVELLKWAKENTKRITIHYCPAKVKDAIQLKSRLKRIANKVAKPYEIVDEDGLLVKCVISSEGNMLPLLRLISEKVGKSKIHIVSGRYAEVSIAHLDEVIKLIKRSTDIKRKIKLYVVREHPITHLILEKIPLDI